MDREDVKSSIRSPETIGGSGKARGAKLRSAPELPARFVTALLMQESLAA